MNIRLANVNDAEAAWRIRNQAIRHGCKTVYSAEVIHAWTPDIMPDSQRKVIERFPFYVAVTSHDRPVATGFLDLDNGSIEAVFTLPEWEGKGLATEVINTIKQEACERGLTSLTLASTPNARGFYQRLGFTVVRERFYPSALAKADLPCIDMICALFPTRE